MAKADPGSILTLPHVDWEDIRSFLETARGGSFTSAAAHLGLSINSVRRRVSNLESAVSHQLLIRSPDGIRLTPHGHQVMETAKRMEDVAADLLLGGRKSTPARQIATVRLGAQDSFGPLWLAPRLTDYQARHSDVIVEMLCAFRSADVAALGAEVFVQVGRTPPSEFKSVRLGRIHSVPTISKKFLKAHRMPADLDQLRRHRLVLLDRPISQQVFHRVFPGTAQDDVVRLRTNNSMVQLSTVLTGGGFAWIPTYMHAVLQDLRVVPIGLVFSSDVWLVRRDNTSSPPVDDLCKWVKSSFDGSTFPWFDDQYVPPERFRDHNSRLRPNLKA